MRPFLFLLLLLGSPLLLRAPALAQLEEETVSRSLDLRRPSPPPSGPFELKSYKGRYAYQVACFQRLLPLDATFRRCVDMQRMASGEFHSRLDFTIEPGGKLKSFSTHPEQLEACLMPHALPLRFPAYGGQPHEYVLQVLVASPGVQLGRRVVAKPIAVYPIGTETELRAYRMAASWVFSPWSQAIGLCAELTDQQLGMGYRMGLEVSVTRDGRAGRASLELRGKLASRAVSALLSCVTPFVRAMQVPPHDGRQPVLYRYGTSTAGWGIR